jgi:lysophospholipase L1-like esterase
MKIPITLKKCSSRRGRIIRRIVALVIVAVVAAVLMLAHDGVRFYFLVKNSEILIKQTTPFARNDPNAAMKILVLGDSTAFGTGAIHPENSTAGRVSARYPKASIVNLAVNGLRIAGLLNILKTIDGKTHYDLILIQIGANDIIRLTPMSDIETGINEVLARTALLGAKVIILHSGNVGEAPLFPWYFRGWLSRRSLAVREIYIRAAPAHGAEYVDLIDSPVAKLLRENPKIYYADDLLHLSDAGYGLWFDEIQKHLGS